VRFDYPIDDSKLTLSQIRGARPSPDGTRLVFTALDKLWIADLPQGRGVKKERPAAPAGAGAGGGGAAAATATPAPVQPTPPSVIRNARRLTTGTDVEHAPVWSPDGQYISYVTWNDDAGGDIYRVRAAGGGAPERLTPVSAFFDKIAYTKDGARLIAVRGSKMHRMRMLEDFGGHSPFAELEYVWLPAAGGAPTRITWVASGNTEEGRNAPHVGPDPERLYVWSGGSDGLLSVRLDGTDFKTVLKVTAPAPPAPAGAPPSTSTPDEVQISPDGRRALVRANRNVYMVTVPPIGGPSVPTVSVAPGGAVPSWRLTKVGGDFIGWTADSKSAVYSIGRSFFLHDLALAAEVDASNRANVEIEAERAAAAPAPTPTPTTTPADPAQKPVTPAAPPRPPVYEYEPHRVDVEIIVDKDKPRGTIALRNARVITMRGDEVLLKGDIVITDNRITAIGPSGKVTIPPGRRRSRSCRQDR
jgi:dipeptidyl aminopeptidase/acylaminoacyl peptidase